MRDELDTDVSGAGSLVDRVRFASATALIIGEYLFPPFWNQSSLTGTPPDLFRTAQHT